MSVTGSEPRDGLSFAERTYRVFAPIVFGGLWWLSRARGRSLADLEVRRGYLPAAERPVVWVHGASAGEMAAGASLVRVLRSTGRGFVAGYTTTNQAGVEVARRTAGEHDVVSLAPWDSPRWVARAFDRWRPRLVILVETEIWPGLIAEAWRRGVPVICASARIYPRDVPRYRCIAALIRPVLGRVSLVLAQSETERHRFVSLGANPARCRVAGSLKYLADARDAAAEAALARAIGVTPGEPLIVAGSVHDDEVPILFDALERLGDQGWRACIAPRHPSALGGIEAACAVRHWALARRSGAVTPGWRILVLDTMGELPSAYALARIAIVGGAFAAHGGHNPLEPLHRGVPVLFGPNMGHFDREAEAIAAAAPETIVRGAEQLASGMTLWLADDAARRSAVARQRSALAHEAGVTEGYRDALTPWLDRALGGLGG